MNDFTIKPLNTGLVTVDKGAYVTRGVDLGVEVDLPASCWYVTDGAHKIMVDTGMCGGELADWHHHGSKQAPGQAVHEQLLAMGVDPKEIELVIFTHLHWDHCHNMDRFSNARFLVSAVELEFARNPIPPYYKSYEHPKLGKKAPFTDATFETVEGEKEILPGLSVFPTPGHSPGHQSVQAQTRGGTHIITGDAVFAYVNLEPSGEHMPFTIMGRFMDIAASWNSLEEIVRRADVILPGHDMKVFEHEVYPVL